MRSRRLPSSCLIARRPLERKETCLELKHGHTIVLTRTIYIDCFLSGLELPIRAPSSPEYNRQYMRLSLVSPA